MTLLEIIKGLFNSLDLSYTFVVKYKKAVLVVLAALVVAFLCRRVYAWSLTRRSALDKVVHYLISGSARHVDTALSLRNTQPLQAYEHAIYGAVMANTAKDLVDDKNRFSKSLNVDVYAYLGYTNQVLTQIKQSLKAKS